MPEFILDRGDSESAAKFKAIDSFTQGYIEAMFFTSTGTGDDGDLQEASIAELAPGTWLAIKQDCASFQQNHLDLLVDAFNIERVAAYDYENAGRDFWYSRNGHGVGYFDRGLGEVGNKLQDVAENYGAVDLYRGDDGLLYLS